jgi:hypothetical protein
MPALSDVKKKRKAKQTEPQGLPANVVQIKGTFQIGELVLCLRSGTEKKGELVNFAVNQNPRLYKWPCECFLYGPDCKVVCKQSLHKVQHGLAKVDSLVFL